MPIYQGISTKNKAEIIINNVQMGKVYVGDRLVWQKPSAGIFYPEYGLLYNWYAATDSRKISSSDDWIVPTLIQYQTLQTYLGGSAVAGGKMKETGLTYWNSPNTGATNESGFNGRGSGRRSISLNIAFFANTSTSISSTNARFVQLSASTATFSASASTSASKKLGQSVRLLYTGAGTPTSYTGNDGMVYRVVTIGTQTWLADNLSETRFRNGDIIPWYGANPASYFTNAEWDALTTAGCCAYDNTLANVATGFTFPT